MEREIRTERHTRTDREVSLSQHVELDDLRLEQSRVQFPL